MEYSLSCIYTRFLLRISADTYFSDCDTAHQMRTRCGRGGLPLFYLITTVLALGTFAIAHAAPVRTPSERELKEWISSRSKTSEALRAKNAEVNESYEIVFVPGILGSQLQIGSFTYGKDTIKADKLVFKPGQISRAATLNEFRAQIARIFRRDVDIYGQGLNQAQAANDGRPLVEFAYDWRDDLDKLADEFERFLEAQLPNKKFVIVAHSMGGVIAWHWKNKFNHQRKHDVIALVTIGSPLHGSCEPVRMLIEGYGPPERSSTFEKWATYLVFGEAHPAVLTFPSVFALLPTYDPNQACLKILRGDEVYALNHHEVGSWLGRAGGDYQLRADFASSAGLDPDSYTQQVTAAIKAGRAFREAFDSRHFQDQIYLLYADNYPLSSSTIVTPRGTDWLIRVRSGHDIAGDGRVSKVSALNDGNFDPTQGAIAHLDHDHGGLLADPKFAKFLQDNIKPLITRAKHTEILAFAAKDSSLRNELIAKGWIADPSLATTPLARIKTISESIRTHIEYNRELLIRNKDDRRFTSIDFGRADQTSAILAAGAAIHRTGDEQTAAALYSTAIASDPNSVDPATFNVMGKIRLKEGRTSEATAYLTRATEAANRPGVTVQAKLRGEIYNNLGMAQERAGAIKPAIVSYDHAIRSGSIDAKKRAVELESRELGRESFWSSSEQGRRTMAVPSSEGDMLKKPGSIAPSESRAQKGLEGSRLAPPGGDVGVSR